MGTELFTSLRIAAASILLTAVAYTAALLGFARLAAPEQAAGQLIVRDGAIVGSRLIAQAFTANAYVWPRPSAANFAADAACGSNLSPANPAVAERAQEILTRLGASAARPAPAELVLASGSGLDPHISLDGARYQAGRVAAARGVAVAAIEAAVETVARADGTLNQGLVNVLLLNLRLDEEHPVVP